MRFIDVRCITSKMQRIREVPSHSQFYCRLQLQAAARLLHYSAFIGTPELASRSMLPACTYDKLHPAAERPSVAFGRLQQ